MASNISKKESQQEVLMMSVPCQPVIFALKSPANDNVPPRLPPAVRVSAAA